MTASLSVGIDLGGTQLRVAVVDRAGRIAMRASVRTDVENGPDGVLRQIDLLFSEVKSGVEPSTLAGVGISSPGPLDSAAGVVLEIPTLPGWNDIPIRDLVSARLGLPTLLENDGISAAIGEWRYGGAERVDNLVYLTISTGIGGGVIADGRVVRGRRGFAGHLGHMIIDQDSAAICSCGARGCFEALAAGPALSRRARKVAARPDGATLLAIAGQSPVDASHVTQAARAGDPAAIALLEEEAKYLGVGFAGVLHAFSPDIIVVGGGVSKSFDLMQNSIGRAVRDYAMPAFRDVPIVPARLGDDSGLIGAASLVFERC